MAVSPLFVDHIFELSPVASFLLHFLLSIYCGFFPSLQRNAFEISCPGSDLLLSSSLQLFFFALSFSFACFPRVVLQTNGFSPNLPLCPWYSTPRNDESPFVSRIFFSPFWTHSSCLCRRLFVACVELKFFASGDRDPRFFCSLCSLKRTFLRISFDSRNYGSFVSCFPDL